jgi:hypothetical protein
MEAAPEAETEVEQLLCSCTQAEADQPNYGDGEVEIFLAVYVSYRNRYCAPIQFRFVVAVTNTLLSLKPNLYLVVLFMKL